jgi:Amidohydrolase
VAVAGIHGVRLNFETAGERSPDNAKRTLAAIAGKGRGWHIQFNAALPLVVRLKDELAALPMLVVIDHFARSKAAAGPNQPGFDVLLALVKSGRAYVKLSATYRISDKPPDYPDAPPIALAIISANPDRAVWGSNRPHPGRGKAAEPFFRPDPHDDAAVARSGGQGRPHLGAARRAFVLDGREHGGRLVCVGIGRMTTLVVDRGEIPDRRMTPARVVEALDEFEHGGPRPRPAS